MQFYQKASPVSLLADRFGQGSHSSTEAVSFRNPRTQRDEEGRDPNNNGNR